ncbi:MAG: endonuclease/exonuclease/phosphatase family protein [Marmoricola sp.]
MNRARLPFWIAGLASLAVATTLVGARFANHFSGNRYLVLLTFLTPAGFIAAAISALLLLALVLGYPRRLASVVLALALAVGGLAAWQQWPLYSADTPPAGLARITVITTNLMSGHADLTAIMTAAEFNRADVIVFEEMTPNAAATAASQTASSNYPYRLGEPVEGVGGTVVWSRFKIKDARPLSVSNSGWAMKIKAEPKFFLVVGNTSSPSGDVGMWQRDMKSLRDEAVVAKAQGPTIVAGNLNATSDHDEYQRFESEGFRGTADACGVGWQPTWPQPGFDPVPKRFPIAVVRIDHVLIDNTFSCVKSTAVPIAGTDHQAVIATLEPRG